MTKAYKLFNENMQCRGYQYAVGKTYTHPGNPALCREGFHACKSPFDCWYYYPVTSRMALVDLSGTVVGDDERKSCGSEITILNEMKLSEFVRAGISSYIDNALVTDEAGSVISSDGDNALVSTEARSVSINGDYSHVVNAGQYAVSVNTLDNSAAVVLDHASAAITTSDNAKSVCAGICGVAACTGYWSTAVCTGPSAIAANTGNNATTISTGRYSASVTIGSNSSAIANGPDSVVVSGGDDGRAKGAMGCALVLVERGSLQKIINVWAGIVGQNGIKPDVYYILCDGKPQEYETC